MENLEKVELVREKCNVSYEEAREALETCDYDVLDAIVMLERKQEEGVRAAAQSVEAEASYEQVADGTANDHNAEGAKSRAAGAWKRFCTRFSELWNAGMAATFVAEHGGERLFALPVAIVVLGLLLWGASLWLLVIGLFFGCRYHIEGLGKTAETVNDAMNKVADAADNIKESIA